MKRVRATACKAAIWLCVCLALSGCQSVGSFVQFKEVSGRLFGWFYSTASEALPDSEAVNTERGADFKPIEGAGRPVGDDAAMPETQPSVEYDFPVQYYPYRAMLSEPEQAAYDLAYSSAVSLVETFTLFQAVSTDRIDEVIRAFFYDHPELFWLETSYGYTYDTDQKVRTVTLLFNETAGDIDVSKKRFETQAQSALAEASKLDSDVEKEKYIHDFLLQTVEYNPDSQINQSAYSALVGKQTVCAGYARAFQYLMMQLNIPCYYCVGDADGDHAWDIIGLEGAYYHIDVAWDDPIGNENSYFYEYFNLTDAEIAADHTRTGLSLGLPACNSTAMGYNNVFGSSDISQIVRKGSNLLTYQELGFTRSDILRSFEDYCDESCRLLVEAGEGTHTFNLLLEDAALQQEIYDAVENKEWSAFVADAAEQLGFYGYSSKLELSSEELADGYYHLVETITLNGQYTGAIGQTPDTEQEEPHPSVGRTPAWRGHTSKDR